MRLLLVLASLALPLRSAEKPLGLSLGAKAPEFSAVDSLGRPWSLAQARNKGPIALVFYRGSWCGFCVGQLRELNETPLLASRAVKVPLVALSVDSPEKSEATRKQFELGFPLLSVKAEVLKAYGIANPVNWKDKPFIAHPAVFVLDEKGVVSYAFADANYRNRAPADALMEALGLVGR